MTSESIKKISIKTVCGTPTRVVTGQSSDGKDVIEFEKKNLMRVGGICTGTKSGETTYGTYTVLRGQFEAVDLETGETYRSSKCFLPDDVIDLISTQFYSENVKAIEFGFIIGVRPNDSQIGYEYTAESILETSKNDPLSLLMNKIDQKMIKYVDTDSVQDLDP